VHADETTKGAIVRVTVSRHLVHRCPYVDEIDIGSLTATWEGDAVELHALARTLDAWRDVSLTHEAITDRIAAEIAELGGRAVEVQTVWDTAGMRVVVDA
jgi:NADPH-dependent 7-cyano-7-deazaguanine reductase QueF